ncbi:MAG: 50S ribosomal protein L1 [Thermoproteales archaeon]|nr:50S ribosomal protein L1 [Thermoproteales archaeon]RLE66329.1 MAG: 50S ribosomal protein L1 [Thermoprotei archaeon]
MSAVIQREELIKAIREIKANSKRRNFVQSVELIVKLRDIDLKKPENRLMTPVHLPYVPPEKQAKICVFATGDLALRAKNAGADAVFSREDLENLSGSKKEAKKLASEYDFFLAQPDLMAHVGRVLGRFLGPRGKIPTVLPPNANVEALVARLKNSRMIRVRDQPQVMCWVGLETQPEEEIAENILRVLEVIATKYTLPQQLEKMYLKLTMGPSVRVR